MRDEMTNAERRAAVMAKVEAKLREIWPDEVAERKFADFDELEAMAVRTGDHLSQEVMSEGLSEALAVATEKREEVCPQCGRKLQWSKVDRRISTIRGPVKLKRDYGYCRGCGRGFFPR